MKIHLKALGCRLNEAELEQWAREYTLRGHQVVSEQEEADLVVLNTCAVTGEAARKSRNLMKRLHRANPRARLVVSGCHATLSADEVAQTLGVDLVVPNSDKEQLVTRSLEGMEPGSMPLMATEPGEAALFRRGRHRAFIKVQDGCRYRCTFCIVTVARGEERSRSIADIVDEANRLHAEGIHEIVLAGVHVGGYGSDIDADLAGLVRALLQDTDVPRIRFASVEPWDLPEDFFSLFENPRLMPHMHLPLQSGSDAVLRRMARRCKTAQFRALVERAREAVPGFNVTTDIIAGFPGETEEDWQQTLAFVEEIGFGHIHAFTFSPREGTKAARLPEQIPHEIRKRRTRELVALAGRLRAEAMKAQLGSETEVLWERPFTDDAGRQWLQGYTRNYFRVQAPAGTASAENRIQRVGLVDVDGDALIGTVRGE
ncbi:MAG: tRNA (N(6)-L-threonylcarbamoyladenosine(37)-C(2))-methylthiotransferase MtaB [Gammaproteobacteria bacterium]|nr:MAG: tRNA (N(6)-L-threonylcarbamoyladenosine(37)-C(2))-methylthiotransferase MtaB [Gammaproteobacteria bacterium]